MLLYEVKWHMIVTLEALFALYQKAFLQSSQEHLKVIEYLSNQVADVCTQATTDNVKDVNAKLMEAVEHHCPVENHGESVV